MKLEAVGIQPSPRGQIEVNAHYQTAVPHIYAAGDVIGFPALASTSMEQRRVAMVPPSIRYKTGVAHILPYGIYTIPECSVVAKTESSPGKEILLSRAAPCSQKAQIVGDRDGFLASVS